MSQKLPSKSDLFSTLDAVEESPDYSKAVGSLMLENSKTSSKLKKWTILFLIIQILLAALAAAALYSLYSGYKNSKVVSELKADPLGAIQVESGDIATNAIDFDQLSSALRGRIVDINGTVKNLQSQVVSINNSIDDQTTDAGGTVTSVNTGSGLSGGPITGSGIIEVEAPICTTNERLSWNGSAFQCVAVLGTGIADANTFFAGPDAVSGAPSYRTIVAGDLSGALSSTGPIDYDSVTGDISCSTCLTSVGTAFVASADSGSDQPLNIGDTLSLLGGDGISTVASTGNEVTFNLTNTGITPATYGSASSVPTFTVDSKGRLTSASSTAIAINASAITSGTLSVTRGGTGVNGSAASNGQLLIGNGSGYSLSTLTGAGPVGITNSAGGISIDCATCVTTSGNGNITSTGGDITLGGTTTGRLIGSGNVNYDLSTTGVVGATYGSANQVATFTVDSKGRLTGASSTSIAINASAITAGTLSALRGGTGVDGSAAANGQLLIGNGSGYSLSTLTGSGPVGITNSAGGISIGCATCVTTGTSLLTFAGDAGSSQSATSGQTVTFVGGVGLTTTGSATRNITVDLDNTAVTAASYGTASSVGSFTVDAQGRITNASNTAIAISASAITSGTLSVTRGGTGVDGSSATNGQLLIGNGSGYSLSTLTGSGPVGITNSAGGISIDCATCVTTSGNGNITSSGGDITLGGTTTGRLIGSGNVDYELSTTGVVGATYGSANQVATFTVDSKGRLTGAGSTTINGLTSSNLSGTAGITNAQLQNSALTISSGNGLSGGGSISLGGSSSLAISAPTCLSNERLSWNGSAFICSMVAAGGSEAANTFFAGPTSGGAAAPAFRGIVTADLGTGTANDQSFLRGDQTWFQLLDAGGKIDPSLLPSSGLNLQGSWNANTNSPTLADGGTGGVQGDFYIVNTAGTTSIDGTATWNIGDWILHNGSTWERISNTNAVSSVNGSTGAVVLDTDDVSEGAGNLYFTNARARGAISGTGPISYNSGTGVIDCPTCVTTSGNGNIVVGTGASISGTLTGRLIGAGNVTFGVSSDVPTSVVNDTNVTGSISANALTLGWTGQLSASRGGTGVDGSGASNGQLLIGNGSGYSLSTLTGAGPVGITNSAGGISIDCSTCVTTSGNGDVTSTDGDVDFSGTTTGRFIGSGDVNFDLSTTGVTGASYGSADEVATFTVDSKGRLTAAGNTSIAIDTSAITSGALSVTRGGTGVDGSGASNGQLLIGNGSGYSLSTLTGAGPVGITNSAGGISIDCSTCVTTGTSLLTFAGDAGSSQSATSGQTVTFVGGVGLTTTGSATRNITVDLDNTAVTAASYGTASSVGSFTVDAQGRITNASNTAIALNASAITSGTLSVTRGGTGVDGSGASNGQLLIGNGSGYSLATLTGAGPVGITNSAGGIAIDCATCVTTSGNGNITSSGGDITLGGTTTGRLIGSGNVNYDLSTTGVVGATYGSANQVATFTVDSKGRLTGAGSTSIAINASAITAGTLSALRGGTGVDGSTASNGQLLIGNGSGYSLSTLSSSGPIGITNSAGGISVGCSTCVTTGTTLFTAAGDLGVNQSVTSGQTVTFVGGVGLTTTGSATRNITVDLDNTAVTAASYGTASSVGSFTVDAQGRITNASNTAIALNASAITAGTLSVTRGGTGVDGSGASNGQLLIGNGSGYSLATITAGSGISVTNGAGSITIANTGAAATCSVSSSYACNGGNTLGAALTLGTNDTNTVVFETNNATRFTLSSGAATLTGNGATTLTSSGTMTLNSATASSLNIDSGTIGDINIGTSANSKTINIGNTTGTTGINIDSGSGNINLRPGGSGTTANVQIGAGGAGSTTPDLLVLDRKSDAGDPTGTNGAMYYNVSSNKFRCFQNSAWTDCITTAGATTGSKTTYKSADQTNATTTLASDTHLKFDIAANEVWTFRFLLQMNSPAPADSKWNISTPAGVTSCKYAVSVYRNNTSTTSNINCGTTTTNIATSGNNDVIEVTGTIENGANAGTVTLQWAENTASGTMTVYRDSFMNAFKNTGADLAEIYYTHDNAQPGQVVSLDASMKAGVRKSNSPYDSTVLGVISTKPGYVLADSEGSDPTAKPVALALSGRVPVKISDENGQVKAGDPLTSSSTPGVAMKATRSGWVIGMAMEDQTVGINNVMTFVNRSWYAGDGKNEVPSLTGLTMTDGGLAGIEQEQMNQMQDGLSSNNPELVSQALGILKDIQGTVVGQQTKFNELEERLNGQQVAQAVFNGGVVTEDSSFKGKVVFDALTTFNGPIVFTGDATFSGKTSFDKVISQSKDQAGTAIIPAGSTSTRVAFSAGAYDKPPIVTATPIGEEALSDLRYSITDVSASGFTIIIKPEQLQDIKFNYIVVQTR